MSKKDYLYELIQSLDKSEKRYFKLYYSGIKKEQKHVLLFDAMEKTKDYDEKKLKQNINDSYIQKHFAETKYYLYQQILKVLKDYRTENSVDNLLIERVQNIEVLIQKALFEQAVNELHKAKKMAYDYERFEFLTLLFSYQNKIIVSTRLHGYTEIELEKLWLEKSAAFQNFTDTQTARHKVMQLMESKNRIGYIKTKQDKLFYTNIKKEIEHLLQEAKCNIAKIYAMESLVFYYNHTGEKKQQNLYCKKLIALHTENPSINASNPYQLPSAIHNLCLSEINIFNFDEVINWIKIQKSYLSIIQNDAEIKYKVEWSLTSLQSFFYNVSGRFQEGKIITKEIIKWIENTEQIDNRSIWIFYGNCAEILLGAKDYKNFFYCMNKIQEFWNNIDSYNKINYTILQMLAHVDEKNIDSALYFYNFLEKEIAAIRQGNPTNIEQILMQFFHQLQDKKQNKNRNLLLKETHQLLKENEQEIQTGEFEYALWFEQMLTKNSFENLVRQKRKRQAEDFIQYRNEDLKITVDIESFRKSLPKRIR
jgi:hypothetical protein